jgi:small subunit ribosomal protein S1
LELRQAAQDDRDWWTAIDESYWRALLEQGVYSPETVPPADAQEIFAAVGLEAGIETADNWHAAENGSRESIENKWQIAQTALERGEPFQVRVSGANRGGLIVEWNGMHGFVPASHLNEMSRRLDADERMSELARRIGDSMTVRLIEVDSQQNQLVFSERTGGPAAQHHHPSADLLSSLQPGDRCSGTITTLTTFGAFVDLGGIEGLVHISELCWERIRHPGDLLKPGQTVEVQVLGINPKEGRVALSLKRLRPDPWSEVEARYAIGQLIQGTVTSVVSFGAFVRIEEGLEGLIHISELAEGSFLHPRDVVREGDIVPVRILNIDTAHHRMGLSLRQAHEFGRASSDQD